MERLALEHLYLDSGTELARCEIPQEIGAAVAYTADLDACAGRDLGEGRASELRDGSIGIRNRVPVGIESGITERGRHALDELVGHGVLESLGLVVYGVPAVAEERDEIRLDDPVAADHAERRSPAGFCQLDTLVGCMLQQALLGKPLHHSAHRRWRQLQGVSDLARGGGAALRRKLIYDFKIVLDGSGQRFRGCGHANSEISLG